MEFVKADDVVARLELGPGQRRLRGDTAGGVAHPAAAWMQRELGNGGADGEHAQLGTMPAEIGIAGERAGQHVDHDGGAEAVAGNDDLVRIGTAGAGDQAIGEGLGPGVDVGRRRNM